ncbi:hypothetical protein FHL15_005612 [Xylaria flabelliformis]|uniref:Uncharacterized protein n=1 Tax=Xylaria flabelliformis TaxID=2512241 RepID=A0A553I0B4_9PEZI|nr:hypothetical protein FHL15_005612 [Xylaria flabelliformis]
MKDEPLLIILNEEPIEDGEFRTRNSEGQRFRPNLVDRGNSLSTQVDIVGITHGKFSKTPDFATLLVFELRFLAKGGRRFKKATVMFQFEDAGGSTARDPVVHAIAPKDRSALNKTDRVRNVKWGVNATANVGMDAAGAQMGTQWEVEEIKNQTYYTAVSGEKRLMRRDFTGEANTAIWTLEENEYKSDGIPNFMRTTVLLRRPQNVPFSFVVKVNTDVDFIGEIKTLFGRERKDPIDPVEIDPTNRPESRATISSLDPKLHRLDEMDRLNLKKAGAVMVAMLLDGDELATVEHSK